MDWLIDWEIGYGDWCQIINKYFLNVSPHAELKETGEQTFSRILCRNKAARRYGSAYVAPFRQGAQILFCNEHTCDSPSEKKWQP